MNKKNKDSSLNFKFSYKEFPESDMNLSEEIMKELMG